MIGSIFFVFNRLVEIVFLIPIIGMLVCSSPITCSRREEEEKLIGQAFFVDGFLKSNEITPVSILVLFIVSVVAIFWCLDTLIRLNSTKRSAIFVVFVDLCFFGAFIASVYELRFIGSANCSHWSGGSDAIYKSLGPFGLPGKQAGNPLAKDLKKTCSMLKASFAIGIMEVLFFMWTAILAFFLHLGHRKENEAAGTSHSHRGRHHHGRRRSHSSRRGREHSGSRHSRPHYVV